MTQQCTNGLAEEEVSRLAGVTWQWLGREKYCHLSSPRACCNCGDPKPHADYIDPADIPTCWEVRQMTFDIAAKAKQLAVIRLLNLAIGWSE